MPTPKYNSYRPKTHPSGEPLHYVAPTLPDVKAALKALLDGGDSLSLNTADHIPSDRYTHGRTHFQGVQRLQNSRYLVISGGDKKGKCGNLFVAKMESRNPESAWRTNSWRLDKLPDEGRKDRIVLTLNVNDDVHGVDPGRWHVGGISTTGDVLAAGVENPDGGSVVLFYNFRIPEQPTLLRKGLQIERDKAMAGAVAITDLPNGHVLVAVLGKHEDDQKRYKDHYLDFYLTGQPGWSEKFVMLKSLPVAGDLRRCQNINFIKSKAGELFMLATWNDVLSAGVKRDERVDLYEVTFGNKTLRQVNPTGGVEPKIKKCRTKRRFKGQIFGPGGRKYAEPHHNMSASAGAYLHPRGALFIYSTYHWRDHLEPNRIRFAEFRPSPLLFTPTSIQSIHEAWVDLWVDDTYRNTRLGLSGADDTSVPNLRKAVAQGQLFRGNLSSLRCQIPPDMKLVLYARTDYEKRDGFKEIKGTGKVISKKDLKKEMNFGDKTLSCRIIPIDQQE